MDSSLYVISSISIRLNIWMRLLERRQLCTSSLYRTKRRIVPAPCHNIQAESPSIVDLRHQARVGERRRITDCISPPPSSLCRLGGQRLEAYQPLVDDICRPRCMVHPLLF